MAGLGSQHRIGKYIVDTELGRGGMGVVYNAHDDYRRVAIKMMLTTLSSNPKLMGRFQREAQLTARLQHPNIVTVYDWGEQDGAPYLVMQYLEGSSLDACRFDVPPTMALLKKLRIVSQVCAGLQYAHSQKMDLDGQTVNGIVHRDIKPANIFVLSDETVKLLDFGIAHLGMDGDGAERPMTRTGQLIGSLNYMSPEQANGARLDTRTDIFSLGVVLYELVAGVRPFEGHDTISTITRILTAPPPPIEQYLPDCPPDLVEVILRALEKSPRDRYQTAEELAFDLSLIETQLRRQLAKEQLELAEAAMERSDWVKALEILSVLLKLDGEHVRGLSMHREVQRILRRQHRAELAARLKEQATEALEKRHFKDALRLAEEAVGLDDSNYDLVVLRDDIRKSLQRSERSRLAAERAENNLRSDRLTDAERSLSEAFQLDPGNTQALKLQPKVADALAEQNKRAQFQAFLKKTVESLDQRRYQTALDFLTEARGLNPNATELDTLTRKAVQGQEQERREQEVKALGEEIRALAVGSIDQAEEKLTAAMQSYPDEPSLLELEDTLSQLRREEAVRLALERAENGLEEQRLEDAQAAVDEVLSLDPANPNAEQVALRISAAVAERARRAQLRLLVQQARESLSQQRYGDALNHLRVAQGLDANDLEVAGLIEQAVQGQEQERRRQELQALGEEIWSLLAARSIDQAEEKLSAAMRSYPGEPSLLELEHSLSQLRGEEALRLAVERAESCLQEQRLEDAQAAVDEALSLGPGNPSAEQVASRISAAIAERARRAQLQLLVQQARESLSQPRYGDALNHLRAAEGLDANNLEVAGLIEQAVQGQQQERRELELKALGEEIRALLAAGSIDQAEEKLSAAMRSYPNEPSLLELELALSQWRRGEAVRLALERAGNSLQEKRPEDAQAALDEVLSLDPANASARHLQPRIERARFKRAQASSLMDQASKEIEMRRYSSALDLLKQAKGLDTGIAGLDELVQRALEGQAKEKRQRAIDSLDEEIRELIATENFKIAGARLTAALGQFAEEQQFLDLDQILKQKQSAAELRQAKEKQDREIFTIFKNIRKLIGDGKLSLAQTRLTTALQRFPDEPALLELSRELFPTRDQEQQPTIMLTVTEAPPAPLEELPQVSADDTAFIESLTQGMETGLLTSSGTAIAGHDEAEVKLEPPIAGPQVAPATDWTLWQDAVPAPAPVEAQPEPPKPFTVFVDDFVTVHNTTEDTTQAGAVVEVEPSPPLEPTAPITAEAAVHLSPETISVYESVAPVVVLAKAEPAPPQPTNEAPVNSSAVAAPGSAVAWVEPKVAVPAPRVPPRVDIPAPTPPARPWLVWGAVAAVVLAGIVYGVVRLSSPAKIPPAIITVPFSIGSDPAGAKVQVEGNGQSKDCVTPLCALSLPPGSYQVKATLAGYEESNRTLEVQAGLPPYQIHLTPISLVGPGAEASSLVVQTPGVQNASVFVDGKEFKVSGSELSISGNLHNTYQIQVKKDGYQPSASEPFTLAHSTEKLVVRLKELPNAATLILDKSTPNADVLIDDKSAGRMSSSGRFQTTVPPGPHKIQLSLDGRASDPGSRQFDPRARVTLSLNVPPPPPPIVQKPPAETAKETTQTPPPPVVKPPTPPPDVAKTMWESIKDTTDPDMLIKFGNQYPEYADRARERVTVLDQKTWDAAKDSGDERRLKSYLTVFPGGKYVSNAREAIDGFHKNTDEAGVRQALDRFNQAVNAMNMDQLHGAWLGMSPTQAKRYKQLFANSSKIESRISVSPDSIKVAGNTAEVECQQTILVIMAGQRSSTNGPLRITLRRNDNGWVIDQVD